MGAKARPLKLLALAVASALLHAGPVPGSPTGNPGSGEDGADAEESAREAQLEAATREELRRQEELLRQLDARAAEAALPDVSLGRPADPRAPPLPPRERELPLDIFDERRVHAPAGPEAE